MEFKQTDNFLENWDYGLLGRGAVLRRLHINDEYLQFLERHGFPPPAFRSHCNGALRCENARRVVVGTAPRNRRVGQRMEG
jgi:hypothetical protein